MKKPSKCLECGTPNLYQARGLCYPCYSHPEIRERYPRLKGYRPQRPPKPAAVDFEGEAPDPVPTRFAPGTRERLLEYARRVARKESVFSEKDAVQGDGIYLTQLERDEYVRLMEVDD